MTPEQTVKQAIANFYKKFSDCKTPEETTNFWNEVVRIGKLYAIDIDTSQITPDPLLTAFDLVQVNLFRIVGTINYEEEKNYWHAVRERINESLSFADVDDLDVYHFACLNALELTAKELVNIGFVMGIQPFTMAKYLHSINEM